MKSKKQLSFEVIERWLTDGDWCVRAAAMNACSGRDVPLEVIERGLTDGDCDVRAAAMNACSGRDVPLEVIERWLTDGDWRVRAAAMNACIENGMDVPLIRTIEPPDMVYKKCVGSVIICASIPNNAQIRGSINGKCRANKAIITDVIGDFCGEQVGISIHDRTTVYYVGDEIEIEDFDFSNEECSTGFHFFCKRELAEKY
jgi:hypothetical protein